MIPFEEVKRYLPQYLTATAQRQLFAELKAFPSNIDQRVYTCALERNVTIFQGDGLRDLLVINLPETKIGRASCMVVSNTCDVDPENQRPFPASVCYAPILRLRPYAEMLQRRSIKTNAALEDHLNAIRAQLVTQIFFLPRGAGLAEDSFVFLDRICHCSSEWIAREDVPGRRIFTLSHYGAYLLLLKLSIHFTRMTDQVDRSAA